MFEVNHERGLLLSEIADGVNIQDIKAATGCSFEVFTSKSLHGMDSILKLTMHGVLVNLIAILTRALSSTKPSARCLA